MSGTKSPFPKAPVTEALIVAHGQPSDPVPAEERLSKLATRVAALLPEWTVRSATLAAPGALEEALVGLRMPLIYPFFMADGWFTKKTLPERLGDAPHIAVMPLGLDNALVAIAERMLCDEAGERGWDLSETQVLLAAHGSETGKAAARSARDFADKLGHRLPCEITTAFLEEAPFLSDVAAQIPAQSICLPFFAADGGHVVGDIPEDLSKARFTGPLLPPLGMDPAIPHLIAAALSQQAEQGIAA